MSVRAVPYGGEDPANQLPGVGVSILGVWHDWPAAASCWCGEVSDLALRDGAFLCKLHRAGT